MRSKRASQVRLSKISEFDKRQKQMGGKALKRLSLEEKIGQLLQVRFYADYKSFDSVEYMLTRQELQRYSAVRYETTTVLIVAEGVHGSAQADVQRLTATITDEIKATWSVSPNTAILNNCLPRFDF
jgi:hypothetical protein